MVFDAIPKDKGLIPFYFPGDNQALPGIREIAEKGNPEKADHTLKNVDSFSQWEDTISQAAKKNATTRSLTILSSILSKLMSSFIIRIRGWFYTSRRGISVCQLRLKTRLGPS